MEAVRPNSHLVYDSQLDDIPLPKEPPLTVEEEEVAEALGYIPSHLRESY